MSAGVPIIRAGPVPVPLDYPVPVGAEMSPIAVSATFADPTNAGPYVPALVIVTPDGHQLGPYPLGLAIAAGASARVSWFPGGELDIAAAGVAPSGVVVEQGFVVASAGVPKVFATVLQTGRQYIVTVQGTYTVQNAALTLGTPNANAMFPTSEPGRISTQVGTDADCTFAAVAGQPLGHNGAFRLSLDGGATFNHIEPVGGPFGTPQPNYFYTFQLVGTGHALQAQIFDSAYTDNYGELLVTIQTVGGGSSGGGGGSLMPDPSQQPNGAWIRTSGGAAVWSATPQVAETDLNLSDVTTQDVSTTKHGFAPKAPNDASKFLNGVGAYAVPAGTSPLTTKGDLWVFSTVNTREPVGSNGQVLLADSTQTTGVRWGAVPAGSGGAMTQICQSILGANQATFDTNTILGGNIPGSYNNLLIVLYARLTDAAVNAFVQLQFNGDTAANYDWVEDVVGAGGSNTATGAVAATAIVVGRAPASTATANRFQAMQLLLPMYAGTVGDKAVVVQSHEAQSTVVAGILEEAMGGTWRSTAAVTRIVLSDQSGGNFVTGSAFFLYGIT